MKEIPILYERKELCCGCTACYSICPKNAIKMLEDEEGFDYPIIESTKCIMCYKCIKVCPIKRKTDIK
ncbi:NADH-quinone oxidoreductase subunit I [Acetivibrio straminisolvens]|jgi:formate hydrogenlyase subunit 6/NADH:ubiquinone oxidoreductase subunit I|uniref:F420H2:quinone oxidoreductase n=1 Tax=Acetivibrio straminisolvens JCM 21531 TaxID=1294263 RepID=W4VB19_9FIRM|nr:4Fe-4S dicluster domain-containing protein [Acetivibrio straminisolvens]GAE89924.1 F420H2:quinone oxidoreductase [Acetivibrio straminisolvens JCM 21531]